MVVYLGTKPVGINKVVEKKVAKTKYGVSIDNLLGDVDENGALVSVGEPFSLDMRGIRTLPDFFLAHFAGDNLRKLQSIRLDDLSTASVSLCHYFASNNDYIREAVFGVENIFAEYAFAYAFRNTSNECVPTFMNLKQVQANYCFERLFTGRQLPPTEKIFPVLEILRGNGVCRYLCSSLPDDKILRFNHLSLIEGGGLTSNATFAYLPAGAIFVLPKCTDLKGKYIFPTNVSEIHFAAENQAAIEASQYYSSKWGATSATIYFDL